MAWVFSISVVGVPLSYLISNMTKKQRLLPAPMFGVIIKPISSGNQSQPIPIESTSAADAEFACQKVEVQAPAEGNKPSLKPKQSLVKQKNSREGRN